MYVICTHSLAANGDVRSVKEVYPNSKSKYNELNVCNFSKGPCHSKVQAIKQRTSLCLCQFKEGEKRITFLYTSPNR